MSPSRASITTLVALLSAGLLFAACADGTDAPQPPEDTMLEPAPDGVYDEPVPVGTVGSRSGRHGEIRLGVTHGTTDDVADVLLMTAWESVGGRYRQGEHVLVGLWDVQILTVDADGVTFRLRELGQRPEGHLRVVLPGGGRSFEPAGVRITFNDADDADLEVTVDGEDDTEDALVNVGESVTIFGYTVTVHGFDGREVQFELVDPAGSPLPDLSQTTSY